jgi:malonyl CoA-acyl carrier protein transacylase/acyl carrier protein
MLTYLDEQTNGIDLASLSYTTTARRVDYPLRVAFSVSNVEELKQHLRKAGTPCAPKAKSAPRIGFVIAGNGSQYRGMGKALYDTSPTFRANMDYCDGILKGLGESTFLGIVNGEVDPFALNRQAFLSASVCIFSIGYSLGMMWKEWGVNPSVVIGHSLGEFAGLVLVGCLTVEDAIRLIVLRSSLLFAPDVVAINGGMLVLGVGEMAAQGIVKESGCSKLNLSCLNGPTQTTISGPRDELVKLEAFVQALPQPPLAKMLNSPFPWHSPLLDEPAEAIRRQCENMKLFPAHTALVLNATGSLLQVGQTISTSYLGDQMVLPVRFDLCIAEPAAQGVDIWIELSAKALLLPLLRPLVPSGVAFLPTLGGLKTDCWSTITKALGRLYEAHAPINWAAYHRPYQPKLLSLPSYPFARNEHWVEYQDRLHLTPSLPQELTDAPRRNVLSTPLGSLEVLDPWHQYRLQTKGPERLHPGSYMWLALSCAHGNAIADFKVTNPTAPGDFLTILIDMPNSDESTVSFIKHLGEDALESGVLVAKCTVEPGYFTASTGTERVFQRSRTKLLNSPSSSFFGKALASKMLNTSLETIGGDHALDSLTVSEDGEEAVGKLRWQKRQSLDGPNPIDHDQMFLSPVPLTPAQLRSLLHPACLAMFLSSGTISPNAGYVIGRLDFAERFISEPRIGAVQDLTVHVFLDVSTDTPEPHIEGSQSYIYSQGGAALARVTGFKKSPSVAPLPLMDLSFGLSNSMMSNASTVVYQDTHYSMPSPPDSPPKKKTPLPIIQEVSISKPANDTKLTSAAIIEVLSRELGVPVHGVSDDDMLEDLGVDSIMSLLLRDQFSKLAGKQVKWFLWQRGLTVRDLSDHALRASV